MNNDVTTFIGKITAGATHEMNNVLAIIKESSGLMEDFISMAKPEQLPQRERMLNVLAKISAQIERGVDLSKRLNSFAHGVRDRSASHELNKSVTDIVALNQRFARSKKATLTALPSDRHIYVAMSPLQLQIAVFTCLEYLLNLVGPGAIITLKTVERRATEAVVDFVVEGIERHPKEILSDPNATEMLTTLRETAEQTGCRIETNEAPVWFTLLLEKSAA